MSPVSATETPVEAMRPYVPSPVLRRWVSGVGYEMRGSAPGVHRGLPSCAITFVIPLETRLELLATPDGRAASMVSCVGGLHTAPATIGHDGTQVGVQLVISPAGARALFGMPASAMAETVVELDELWGGDARELLDRLHGTASWATRLAALDEVLGRVVARRGEVDRPPDEVSEAWRRLAAGQPGTTVSSVARDVGWSRRHLAQRFAAEVGISPKALARVARFQRAVGELKQSPETSLATVAARVGYADQAHMTREWRALAGSSPAAWRRAEGLVGERPVVAA